MNSTASNPETQVRWTVQPSAYEEVDEPVSLSVTLSLVHPKWGVPVKQQQRLTDDGRVRRISVQFANDNQALIFRGRRLDESVVRWVGVVIPKRRGIAEPAKSAHEALIKAKVKLGFDELNQCITVNEQPITDALSDRLWLEVGGMVGKKEQWNTIIGYLAHRNPYHPVRRYLNGLEWDGKARLDTWLIDHLGAEDTPLNRAIGRITLIAGARRVRQPGCKFDELPIFEGKQGTQKSSAVKVMAVQPEWYTDGLSLKASQKVLMEDTAGAWIVEIPELQGYRDASWEQLKATLSRTVDTARMAYGRYTERRPRAFIAIGTTNAHKYLSDPTGNRRFWPVCLDDRTIDLERLRDVRDQLWAEAARAEAAGETIRLDPTLWEAAANQQALRANDDPWLDRLRDVLGDVEGRITMEDVWTIVGRPNEERVRRTAGEKLKIISAMTALGWKQGADKGRIQVKGKRFLGWVRTTRPAHVKVPLWRAGPDGNHVYQDNTEE